MTRRSERDSPMPPAKRVLASAALESLRIFSRRLVYSFSHAEAASRVRDVHRIHEKQGFLRQRSETGCVLGVRFARPAGISLPFPFRAGFPLFSRPARLAVRFRADGIHLISSRFTRPRRKV